MGIIVRQSILTSVISYLGIAIGYINVMYLYPKFLEPEQVGLLRTIQDAAMLFTPFAVFGLGQSIIRFFPHFAENRNANSFISLILTLALFTYGIFLLIFFMFQDHFVSFFDENAGGIIQYTSLILWLTFFLLFINLLEQYSRSLMNIAFPSLLRDVGVRILQGLLVTVYFVRLITFHEFLIYSIVIYLLILAALALNLFARGFRYSTEFREFRRDKLKEIFSFSSLSFIGMSAMILIGKMDSIMVSGLIGLASNAIYTTAFFIATVIEVPKRAITTAASTLIAKAFERNDLGEVRRLYEKTSINQLIIGSLLLIGIWANISNIFAIMPRGEVYRAGTYVVLIVGCGKLIDMAFGPSSEIIGLSRHYWFNLVVITILAVVVIISNYVLIPVLGIEGAACGTILALLVYNVAKYLFIYFRLGLQPFTASTGKVLAIGLIVLLLNSILPKAELVMIDIGYRSFIITLVFGALIIQSRSSEEVSGLFIKILNRLRNKNQ